VRSPWQRFRATVAYRSRMPYADCTYCGEPIPNVSDAVVARETPPGDDDAGEVRYRHPDCSAVDADPDRSTSIEM